MTIPSASETSSSSPFLSDSPLPADSPDIFPERRAFALRIARSIVAWKGRESCIISLNSPWGSGKSTVKNIILSELGSLKYLEFNPWQWQGTDQLADAFLTELGNLFEETYKQNSGNTEEKKHNAVMGWRRFQLLLTGTATVTRGILKSYLLTAGVDPATADGLIGGMDGLVAMTKQAQDYRDAISVINKPMSEVKKELAQMFSELEQPLLVVMDDLDRLSPQELKEIFQLVKANADFPNVVYLLLYHEEIVANNLGVALAVDGRKYLEKIIQVPLPLPPVRAHQRKALLERHLKDVFSDIWLEVSGHELFGYIYRTLLEPFFETTRDITRFFSAFSFLSSGLWSAQGREVDPLDFLAIEVLRFFEPDVYQAVAESTDLLINPPDKVLGSVRGQSQSITSIIELATEPHRYAVRQIIAYLFPKAAPALDAISLGGSPRASAKNMRVCSAPFTNRYFLYAVPTDDVSRVEVQKIFLSDPTYEQTKERLEQAKQKEVLPLFLGHLAIVALDQPLTTPTPFLLALFDLFTAWNDFQNPNEWLDLQQDAADVVTSLISQDAAYYLPSLRDALSQTNSIWMSCLTVRQLAAESAMLEFGRELIAVGEWHDLTEICTSKVEQFSQSSEFFSYPAMVSTLFAWNDWDKAGITIFLESVLTNADKMLALIRPYYNPSTESGFAGFHNLDSLGNLIPLKMLSESFLNADKSGLSPGDEIVANAFMSKITYSQQPTPGAGEEHP